MERALGQRLLLGQAVFAMWIEHGCKQIQHGLHADLLETMLGTDKSKS